MLRKKSYLYFYLSCFFAQKLSSANSKVSDLTENSLLVLFFIFAHSREMYNVTKSSASIKGFFLSNCFLLRISNREKFYTTFSLKLMGSLVTCPTPPTSKEMSWSLSLFWDVAFTSMIITAVVGNTAVIWIVTCNHFLSVLSMDAKCDCHLFSKCYELDVFADITFIGYS